MAVRCGTGFAGSAADFVAVAGAAGPFAGAGDVSVVVLAEVSVVDGALSATVCDVVCACFAVSETSLGAGFNGVALDLAACDGRLAAGLRGVCADSGVLGGRVRVIKGRVRLGGLSSDRVAPCTQPKSARWAISTRAAISSRGLSGADEFSTTIST